MAIPAEVIDKIRLGTDIVEIVREHIPTLKKSGRNWKANCPFHHEKTPSFMVSSEKGIFHCFGCNSGGDVFKFLMLIESLSWPQAVRKLADRLGIVIKETKEETLKKSEKQKIYDLLDQTTSFYHRCFIDSKEGNAAREYLKKRGIDEESIKKFQLGFAPKDSLIRSAEKKGISKEQLISAGLITKTERGNYFEYMSDRVVFPIFDSQGRVIAFGGRTLKDDDPKYLNTPETSVYSKSQQLYGLFQALPALRKTNEVIILEGYIDVIVAQQFGLSNSVATLGTSLTTQHSHILKRYCENIILLFDSDKAGNEATKRAIETLLDGEISIKTASLPAGIDLDEYLLKEGKDNFLNFLDKEKKSFIDFLINDAIDKFGIQTVESKVKAVNDVLPFVAKIKNLILRSEAIKRVSEKINVREDAVISELRRLLKKAPLKSEPQGSDAQNKHTKLRNAEEEITQLILAHPEYINDLDQELLKEERTKKIFNFLKDGVSVPEIIEELEEKDRIWFREILLEEKEYAFPEQTLSNLSKDIRNKVLEKKRKELEKEIILMRNGTIPYDDRKFELFKELTVQLKGSGK